ncbi:MAG: hypothetical protein JNJ60_06475, partial [Rhodocyclaceae bacterium]|nr:hypothetical protein [Rhodocyclaceae bacterium]
LAALQPGFASMTVGRSGPDAVGTVHVGPLASGDIPATSLTLQGGDILVEGSLGSAANPFAHNLTLRANAEILFSPGVSIDASGGVFNIQLFANSDSFGGRIVLDQATLLSGGGNISLCGASCAFSAEGVSVSGVGDEAYGILLRNAVVDAGSGHIEMRGTGVVEGSGGAGVHIESSTLRAGAGGITVLGSGGGFSSGADLGVEVVSGSQITVDSGTLLITGSGGSLSSGGGNHGILIAGGSVLAGTGSGNMSLVGVGGSGSGSTGSYGIKLTGAAQLQTEAGAISVHGSGAGSGDDASGVVADAGTVIASSAGGGIAITGFGADGASPSLMRGVVLTDTTVQTAAAGTITISGTGGSFGTPGDGFGNSHGVYLSGSTLVQSADGGIAITGAATDNSGGGGSTGVFLDSSAIVKSTGSGSISISGSGAPAGFSNTGVLMRSGALVDANGSGNVTITGTQGGSSGGGGGGIYVDAGAIVTATAGQSTLVGTGAGSEAGIALLGSVGGATASGTIALVSDLLGMDVAAVVRTSGLVQLTPLTASNSISLATGRTSATVYTPAMLDRITAGTLELKTTGGNILVNADLAGSSVHASTLLLTSGGGITFSAAVGAPAAPFDHHL